MIWYLLSWQSQNKIPVIASLPVEHSIIRGEAFNFWDARKTVLGKEANISLSDCCSQWWWLWIILWRQKKEHLAETKREMCFCVIQAGLDLPASASWVCDYRCDIAGSAKWDWGGIKVNFGGFGSGMSCCCHHSPVTFKLMDEVMNRQFCLTGPTHFPRSPQLCSYKKAFLAGLGHSVIVSFSELIIYLTPIIQCLETFCFLSFLANLLLFYYKKTIKEMQLR